MYVNSVAAKTLLPVEYACNRRIDIRAKQTRFISTEEMGFTERLKNFDGHSTVSKEFRVYTAQGAALSVITLIGE
jgi:hypothetical protein